MSGSTWPRELRFSRSLRRLQILFEDGKVFELPYTLLRAQSPSAEVRGHGSGPPPSLPPVEPDVTVDKADPVGRYAVRLHFSDGHSSGLFTWAYLRQLGQTSSPENTG